MKHLAMTEDQRARVRRNAQKLDSAFRGMTIKLPADLCNLRYVASMPMATHRRSLYEHIVAFQRSLT